MDVEARPWLAGVEEVATERLGDSRGEGVSVGMVGPPVRKTVVLLSPTSLTPRQVEAGNGGQETERANLGAWERGEREGEPCHLPLRG